MAGQDSWNGSRSRKGVRWGVKTHLGLQPLGGVTFRGRRPVDLEQLTWIIKLSVADQKLQYLEGSLAAR